MRTLIIDNYDSFTYNLVHYLAEVTGVTPIVVRNDEPGWTLAALHDFDSVVISPGPGRPERSRDFGICAQVIAESTLPLLGVCLGHQGICAAFGAAIEPAPEPVHGRWSPVIHEQVDVLAGLPSPFSAVRYHSLAVGPLPDELEAIAWTPDGVLMGVRHRVLPMWGLQFHPESIGTAHGRRILRNFADLARPWQSANTVRRAARQGVAAPIRNRLPASPNAPAELRRLTVLHRSCASHLPAEDVFDALYKTSEHAFWLDSSLLGTLNGRFSFMGDAAGPLARIATADVRTGQVIVRSAAGKEVIDGAFLDWIDAGMKMQQVAYPDVPFDFMLGWVGYLGYELKAQCGGAEVHSAPHGDAAMLFSDRAVVFDHDLRTIHLLALTEEDDPQPGELWLEKTAATLAVLAAGRPLAAPVPIAAASVGQLEMRFDRRRYLELVANCQDLIAAGETYEVCLTNALTADAELDPWNTYRLLRQANPAPFGAFLRLDALSVLGCSPERFLHVDANGQAESKPIKGTRPRGMSPAEDEVLLQELAGSEKDRAENLMIVDLVRHDLGTCAEVGSVRVSGLFDVETYPSVHQLVSTVRAKLRPDVSARDCARALFPGGSMTGAPKIRTMQIIDELEKGPRGVYSGVLGYFSLSGAADLAMVIRTLVLSPGRLELGVGGAIIALSDPEAEFEELAVKAAPILRLLGKPSLLRSA